MKLKRKIKIASGIIGIIAATCLMSQLFKPKAPNDKEGILLVTFGSTFPAPQETFKTIDRAAKTKFQDTEINWGYTSDFILKRLLEGKGKGVLTGQRIDRNTPTEALEKMRIQGYSKIAVQSLHIIPGEEFEGLVEDVKVFKKGHNDITVTIGYPLLNTNEDIVAVAKILADIFKLEVEKGPVCFMGHGTRHQADNRYIKLDAALKKLNPKFYIGTVEGISFDANITSIGAIIDDIKSTFPKTEMVTITPLMSISGDHTNNDMNANTGESNIDEQSWRERLMHADYAVNSVMKGLGDYAEINAVWMSHLATSKCE